jgi:hypothetical protein
MSIVTRYTLYCDGCRRSGPGQMGGSMERQAERRAARRAGWKRIPAIPGLGRYSGKDICPRCLPNFPDAK